MEKQVVDFLGYTMIVLSILRILKWVCLSVRSWLFPQSIETLVDSMFSDLQFKRNQHNVLFRNDVLLPRWHWFRRENFRFWNLMALVDLLFPLDVAFITVFIACKIWIGFSWWFVLPASLLNRAFLLLGRYVHSRRKVNAIMSFVDKYKISEILGREGVFVLKVPDPYEDLYYLVDTDIDMINQRVTIFEIDVEQANDFVRDPLRTFRFSRREDRSAKITHPELRVPDEVKRRRRLDFQRDVMGDDGLPL
jgi:hypothetical protein